MTELNFHRSLIRIEEVHMDDNNHIVAVIACVPSWNPHLNLNMPESTFRELRDIGVYNGSYVIGEVTIGADSKEELQFRNFEQAKMPA